ncbi:MAG: DUF5696 domain-containing protein, partial [Oscillospiraceae bacterium]
MLQIRKKILVGVLCAGMVLSASQSVAWSENNTSMTAEADGAETEAAGTAEVSDAAEEDAKPEKEPIKEEDVLASCELAASNENFELFVNTQSGIFAFRTKDGKHIWWSNPYNADDDPVANNSKKEDLKSSLVINAVKVKDTESPSTTVRSYKDSVNAIVETADDIRPGLVVTMVDNGFRAEYTFPNEGITIPYYVTIKDDYIEASIAVDEIYEVETSSEVVSESSRSIVDVNLLQDLGAAYSDETGYIITPDGSGAVINFNNGKSKTNEYTQRIYGRDLAKSQDLAPKKTEQAYLPVLGIVREDNALLEVVTEGSAYATARAAVSGQKSTSY